VKESGREERHVRIGELARRTGVPTRLLRYYEEQELLTPGRAANGYRDYAERLVDRVTQIRGLLDAGLPTKIIKQILPCLDNPCTIHLTDATPELIATLERERERMDARIRCLTRNRDAIGAYLDAIRRATARPGPGSIPPGDGTPAPSSGRTSSRP
jgi:DNA-binding transcriptional MerR regulator